MKFAKLLGLLCILTACSKPVKVKSFTWQELGEPESHEMADRESFKRENISFQSDNTVIIETYMIAPMSVEWKGKVKLEDDTLYYREEPKDPVKKLEKYKFTWVLDTRKRSPKTLVFKHDY